MDLLSLGRHQASVAGRIRRRSVATGVTKSILGGASGLLFLALACQSEPPSGGGPLGFSASDSVYTVSGLVARLPEDDDRVAIGSVLDVVKSRAGYVVADGRNHRLVFLDPGLNPAVTAGRQGDGPGEFEAPYQLLSKGDTIAVLDLRGRVSYMGLDGEFLGVENVVGLPLALDFVIHPQLGKLFAVYFPDHYLGRMVGENSERIAAIPDALRSDSAGRIPIHNNRVALGSNGTIHVLDEKNGVLVSYDPDGGGGRVALLPSGIRDEVEETANEMREAFGSVAVQSINSFHALQDGRLFVGFASDTLLAFILDPTTWQATPVVAEGEWTWLNRLPAKHFDGEDLLFGGGRTVELILAETTARPRNRP